jgi:hypothetical protein
MNENIVYDFVSFYYATLNASKYVDLQTYMKEHTTFVRKKTKYKGISCIMSMLIDTCNNKGTFVPYNIDILTNGDRRANILISGLCGNSYYCEYMHLAYGNDKQYWIHSTILHVVN